MDDCVVAFEGENGVDLALDSAGNPRIAYEIHLQNGGGACEANTWARMTRFAIFNQPATASLAKVYDPGLPNSLQGHISLPGKRGQ